MKRFVVILLCAIGSAVTAPAPASADSAGKFVEATVPDGKAIIYFYQPDVFRTNQLQTITALLLAREGPLTKLDGKSFYMYIADPGSLKFWLAGMSTAEIKLDVAAGQIYYVRASSSSGFSMDLSLESVPRDKALREIASCKPLSN